MILSTEIYRAERKGNPYQSFTMTVEKEGVREFITVNIDCLSRWRKRIDYIDYLKWVIEELKGFGKDAKKAG